jgi:hypothetical protein
MTASPLKADVLSLSVDSAKCQFQTVAFPHRAHATRNPSVLVNQEADQRRTSKQSPVRGGAPRQTNVNGSISQRVSLNGKRDAFLAGSNGSTDHGFRGSDWRFYCEPFCAEVYIPGTTF